MNNKFGKEIQFYTEKRLSEQFYVGIRKINPAMLPHCDFDTCVLILTSDDFRLNTARARNLYEDSLLPNFVKSTFAVV